MSTDSSSTQLCPQELDGILGPDLTQFEIRIHRLISEDGDQVSRSKALFYLVLSFRDDLTQFETLIDQLISECEDKVSRSRAFFDLALRSRPDPDKFRILIDQFISKDEDKVSRSKALFDLALRSRPDSLLLALSELLSPFSSVRVEAAKQIGEIFTTFSSNFRETTLDTLKLDLLSAYRNEVSDSDVRKALLRTISDFHATGSWPELLPNLFECLNSQSPYFQEYALLVFKSLAENSNGNAALIPHLETFQEFFSECVCNSSSWDFKIAALDASISFVQFIPNREDPNRFDYLLDLMMLTLSEALDSGSEYKTEDTLHLLIRLAETEPTFFERQLEEVLLLMLKMTGDDCLEVNVKHLAIELLMALVEKAPSMISKEPRFIKRLFDELMYMIFDFEEVDDFAIAEAANDAACVAANDAARVAADTARAAAEVARAAGVARAATAAAHVAIADVEAARAVVRAAACAATTVAADFASRAAAHSVSHAAACVAYDNRCAVAKAKAAADTAADTAAVAAAEATAAADTAAVAAAAAAEATAAAAAKATAAAAAAADAAGIAAADAAAAAAGSFAATITAAAATAASLAAASTAATAATAATTAATAATSTAAAAATAATVAACYAACDADFAARFVTDHVDVAVQHAAHLHTASAARNAACDADAVARGAALLASASASASKACATAATTADSNGDEDDNFCQSNYYILGKESLRKLSISLGEKTIFQWVLRLFSHLLGTSIWQQRHAVLIAIPKIAEGCPEVMLENLDEIVPQVLKSLNDLHPCVQLAAIKAIRQLSVVFGPGLQTQYDAIVLIRLDEAMKDSPRPRLQVCAPVSS